MRDIVLAIGLLPMMLMALARPELAMVVWSWIGLGHPHRLVYGFLQGAQLNLAATALTCLGLLLAGKGKSEFKVTPTFVLMLVLVLWVGMAAVFRAAKSDHTLHFTR